MARRAREKEGPIPIVPTPPSSLWRERKKEQRDAKAAAAVRALPRRGGEDGGAGCVPPRPRAPACARIFA